MALQRLPERGVAPACVEQCAPGGRLAIVLFGGMGSLEEVSELLVGLAVGRSAGIGLGVQPQLRTLQARLGEQAWQASADAVVTGPRYARTLEHMEVDLYPKFHGLRVDVVEAVHDALPRYEQVGLDGSNSPTGSNNALHLVEGLFRATQVHEDRLAYREVVAVVWNVVQRSDVAFREAKSALQLDFFCPASALFQQALVKIKAVDTPAG